MPLPLCLSCFHFTKHEVLLNRLNKHLESCSNLQSLNLLLGSTAIRGFLVCGVVQLFNNGQTLTHSISRIIHCLLQACLAQLNILKGIQYLANCFSLQIDHQTELLCFVLAPSSFDKLCQNYADLDYDL